MSTIGSHKDLAVWKKSIVLAGKVYAATRQLPSDERPSLGRQLRRAAVAIPSSIAAGAAQRRHAELSRCLQHARGSLHQLETQLAIALEQGFLARTAAAPAELAEVGRLLDELIRTLPRARQAAHAKACAPQQPPGAGR